MGVRDSRDTLSSAIYILGVAVSDLGRGAVQLIECVAFFELRIYEVVLAKEERKV